MAFFLVTTSKAIQVSGTFVVQAESTGQARDIFEQTIGEHPNIAFVGEEVTKILEDEIITHIEETNDYVLGIRPSGETVVVTLNPDTVPVTIRETLGTGETKTTRTTIPRPTALNLIKDSVISVVSTEGASKRSIDGFTSLDDLLNEEGIQEEVAKSEVEKLIHDGTLVVVNVNDLEIGDTLVCVKHPRLTVGEDVIVKDKYRSSLIEVSREGDRQPITLTAIEIERGCFLKHNTPLHTKVVLPEK